MIEQVIGFAMILVVFFGMFVLMARETGFWIAVGIWAFAFGGTAFIVLGVFLAAGSLQF